jgi:predicted nuclease of predicted toxin-antitoxin system
VRFLIDNALSPVVATGLVALGHDAVHVRTYGIHHESDHVVFARARSEGRIVVSADTDFGTILAQEGSKGPSVILFRRASTRAPEAQIRLLADHLPRIEEHLTRGAIVVIEDARIRVRSLPI